MTMGTRVSHGTPVAWCALLLQVEDMRPVVAKIFSTFSTLMLLYA